MQRRQHQVAGLGELNAVFHGLAIADFADEDHIGRLTQGVLQRQMPALAVDADFAVRDHAALVGVHVFHRIFDGDDVAAGLFVAVADHGRERGGLSRAGAAHQDHEAALGQHDLLQDGRQLEFFERRDLGVDGTQHRAGETLLHEGADAKAADARRRDGEIAFLGGVEFLGLPVVHDGAHQARALLGAQGAIGLRPDFAVHLDGGRKAGGDEQIGTLLFHHAPEQVLHQAYCLFAFH